MEGDIIKVSFFGGHDSESNKYSEVSNKFVQMQFQLKEALVFS